MGLVDIQNTNFDNGVTNRNAAALFGSMGQLDPTKFHNYMEDFDRFASTEWGITGAGAGTQVLTNADGGVLLLTTAALDNDAQFLQKSGANFTLAASFRMYYRCRFLASEATQSDVFSSLADDPGLVPDNGVIFRKDDDATTIDLIVRSGVADVATSLAIATLAAATFITLEWYWDGIDRIYFGVNGVATGFVTVNTAVAPLPVGNLGPTFGLQNGIAGIKTGQWDYIFCAKERA